MSQANESNLIWIDLEMTGLDTDADSILEIATIVTDKDLNILAEGPVFAIRHEIDCLEAMDSWNRNQHSRSGLWQQVLDSTTAHAAAELATVEFLKAWVPPGKSPMCGNSICQDRRFMHRQMPRLERYFHYRNLDVSTLKEPYRAEGKKTLGYELAEQLGWKYPDVILYPTGGGTGLIGMWKAFDEMEKMGLIAPGTKRPKMFTVQASGCQPIVRAFEANEKFAAEHLGATTKASGLRVPKAIGDFLMLEALHKSGGGAIAIPDEDMISCTKEVGAAEGVFTAPEGAACYAALKVLLTQNKVSPDETIVLFNTSTGLKYLECYGG
jgi:oligoribonuclease (3'-5' exoribonuclease)